jgi:hypothetical protein
MSDDDKKLPTRVEPAGLPTASQSRSLFGRVGSAFNAILNTKTFQKKTEEAEAYRLYLEESARIPKALIERDREVDTYLYNRDAIIESDRQERQRELDRKRAERKLKRRRIYTKFAWLGSKEKAKRLGHDANWKKASGDWMRSKSLFHTVKNALIIYFDKALSRRRAI